MFHFESLIDPADFGTVRRYLNCSNSPITDVLFVRDERLLATVAELLADEHPTDLQRSHFSRWIRTGEVKVGVNAAVTENPTVPDFIVDLETISDQVDCRVLYLPPYYLVHLRTPPSCARPQVRNKGMAA